MSPDNQTHTLPLALMAFLILLGVAALGLLYYRKRQLQCAVEGQFKGFRENKPSVSQPRPTRALRDRRIDRRGYRDRGREDRQMQIRADLRQIDSREVVRFEGADEKAVGTQI
jgi:hypothetical protein